MARTANDATFAGLDAAGIARKLGMGFKGSLSEKDALEAYLERTPGKKNVPITADRISITTGLARTTFARSHSPAQRSAERLLQLLIELRQRLVSGCPVTLY